MLRIFTTHRRRLNYESRALRNTTRVKFHEIVPSDIVQKCSHILSEYTHRLMSFLHILLAFGLSQQKESLHALLRKSGSDKANHHQYARLYEPLLKQWRSKPIKFLEIGVEDGHSLKVWNEYFDHSDTNILGLAYANKIQESLDDKRISIIHGSQEDPKVLQNIALFGNYSIIIDDGSHVPSHQWYTFTFLWKTIVPGGIYIIEDIETNYWSTKSSIYGNSLKNEHNIMPKFKALIDTGVNSEFYTGIDNTDIESIQFYRNCVILRKHMTDHKSRTYRFSSNLKGSRLPNAHA